MLGCFDHRDNFLDISKSFRNSDFNKNIAIKCTEVFRKKKSFSTIRKSNCCAISYFYFYFIDLH